MSASTVPQSLVTTAAGVYLRRRARLEHPRGSFDRKGRWWPDDGEEMLCCRAIRRPSRAWPYSLLWHCRSAAHVAVLYAVAPVEVRRAARAAGDLVLPRVTLRDVIVSARPDLAGPETVTPEMALRDAGIDDARQAQYQRRLSALLAGRPS